MRPHSRGDKLCVVLALGAIGALAIATAQASNAGAVFRGLSHSFFYRVAPGYLGVDIADTTPAVLPAEEGPSGKSAVGTTEVEVVAVDHDAPAAKAGIQIHDLILEINGQRVKNCDQVRRLLNREPPGRMIALVLGRAGRTVDVSVRLADRALLEQRAWSQHYSVPAPVEAEHAATGEEFVSSRRAGSRLFTTLIPRPLYMGADVSPVEAQLADYFGVTGGTGLLVESVDSDSPASHAGLRAGDIILRVNGSPMTTRGDWLRAIRANQGKNLRVDIMRDKQEQTLTLAADTSLKQK